MKVVQLLEVIDLPEHSGKHKECTCCGIYKLEHNFLRESVKTPVTICNDCYNMPHSKYEELKKQTKKIQRSKEHVQLQIDLDYVKEFTKVSLTAEELITELQKLPSNARIKKSFVDDDYYYESEDKTMFVPLRLEREIDGIQYYML